MCSSPLRNLVFLCAVQDVYPFTYMLPEPPKKSSSSKSSDAKDKEKTKLEEYNEEIRDLKTSWLAKLGKAYQEIAT